MIGFVAFACSFFALGNIFQIAVRDGGGAPWVCFVIGLIAASAAAYVTAR